MKSRKPSRNDLSASSQPQFFRKRNADLFTKSKDGFFSGAPVGDEQNDTQSNDPYEKEAGMLQAKASQHTPSTLIARAPAPAPALTTQQKADEQKVKDKIVKATALLGKARAKITDAGQGELLDEMLDLFNQITAAHIGSLDANRARVTIGTVLHIPYNFARPGQMTQPFDYRLRIDVSQETEEGAVAYFRGENDYGGQIVFKAPALKSSSVDFISEVLVHEAVHLFSHVQRAVAARVSEQGATVIPGKAAGAILDTSSLASHKKAFTGHFNAVRTFLNKQPHRDHSFSELPASIVESWTRKVVEETIAFVYASRVDVAVAKAKAARTQSGIVTIAFDPLAFLKRYMTREWLPDPEDKKAMATQNGEALLKAMSADMIALHNAVEAQVGP